MTTTTSRLFQPLRVGNVDLAHRLVLAPLTRLRATADGVPLPLVKDYYAQRAATPGTLLITEATVISPSAGGYAHAPGIYNAAQVAAWRQVTDAVHARGSHIYMQLWALGRSAQKDTLDAMGERYVSASALPMPDGEGGFGPVPEALTTAEVREYVEMYRRAARNAVEAGFDGVEVHAANGYLPDQFMRSTSNERTDAYGGSIANRARFTLEATQAISDEIGPERVGVRLSPWNGAKGMELADPVPQFEAVIAGLRDMGVGYLHVVLARMWGVKDIEPAAHASIDFALRAWRADGSARPFFAAGGYTGASAREAVDVEFGGEDVCVVMGRWWIANPDLVFRIRHGIELQAYDRPSFYSVGQEKGYTDYPFSEEYLKAQAQGASL